MDAFYNATFVIAIIGSITAFIEFVGGFIGKFFRVGQEVQDYQKEIRVLDLVLNESEKIMENAAEVPKSAEDAHDLCINYRHKLNDAIGEAESSSSVKYRDMALLLWSEKEWKQTFRVYKDSVFLLRDLCANIKTDLGLRNMLAAMARLNEEFIAAPHEYQQRNLVELHNNNYFMVAYVLARHLHNPHGKDPLFVAAKLKIDTGADVDHVSEDFLTRVFRKEKHEFDPIPEERQFEVTGFDGNKYTPRFSVKLEWSRGEREGTKEHEFFIIDGCPCDMVLGSKNFLEQATKIVQIAGSTKNQQRKRDAMVERRKKKSHAEFEEEAARHSRRSVTERSSTGTATATDVEMGDVGGPTPGSRPQGPPQHAAQNQFGEQEGQRVDKPTPRFRWLRRILGLPDVSQV